MQISGLGFNVETPQLTSSFQTHYVKKGI